MRRALSLALAAAVVAGGTLAPTRAAPAADKSTYVLLKAGTLIDGSVLVIKGGVLVKDDWAH